MTSDVELAVKVQEDELLKKRANELLAIKYQGKSNSDLPESGATAPEIPDEINWKFVAAERLQMLVQMRDDMQYWRDAYLHERARADRLVALEYNEAGAPDETQQETKHTISSPAQVNRRRANWPSFKKRAEELTSVHDAGVVLNSD